MSQVLDMFSLKGRVALVTGASSGIGYHLAHTMAKAGSHVIVAARRADKLATLVSELKATGAKADAVSLDVTSQASVKACFRSRPGGVEAPAPGHDDGRSPAGRT